MVPQAVDTATVTTAVTHVTPVTQQKVQHVHVLEIPAVSWCCPVCHGTRRWRSIYDVLICGACHPPADVALVAAWLEDSEE
jgi:hypothetical protein